MLRHILRNKDLFLIGLIEFFVGVVIIMKFRTLEHPLPPLLDWTDDFGPGLSYVVIGVVTIVNSAWDFWWYKIRSFLIIISIALFTVLTLSFGWDGILSHKISFSTFIFFAMLVFSFLVGMDEPAYKLKGVIDEVE
ncbi:hypothetical protein [Eupransor demetentiae]|uniref:Uncharacterized protein n=1 Tax=Eupransor demetentiae TaxID=3109584 RepID=A0ABM9N4L7_9LACO|nr:hypothetical protein R54876_GBNLAHCA_00670 [Lactobacillaceae bacterium LMG 33000]